MHIPQNEHTYKNGGGNPGGEEEEKSEKGQQLSLFLVQNKTILSALPQFPLEVYRATTGQERSKSETKRNMKKNVSVDF